MATEVHTTRPISEKLADLSRRAKAAEDAFETARTATKQKIESHIDQARASVEKLKHELQVDVSSATDRMRSEWQDVQGRVARRVDRIKADAEARKEQLAADRAAIRADIAEDAATAAIADAVGAIEYARVAVLCAVATRQDADSARH